MLNFLANYLSGFIGKIIDKNIDERKFFKLFLDTKELVLDSFVFEDKDTKSYLLSYITEESLMVLYSNFKTNDVNSKNITENHFKGEELERMTLKQKEDVERFVNTFHDGLLAKIKVEMPEIYELLKLEDIDKCLQFVKRDLINNQKNLNGTLANIQQGIIALDKKVVESKILFSISDIEIELGHSNNYGITLDFFDYEDKEKNKEIIESIRKEDVVYLSFKTRKEGLYYLLRLLKYNNVSNVYVVKSLEVWNSIYNNDKYKELILIPFIISEDVKPSVYNKTIFIINDEMKVFGNKHVISIPQRFKKNLYKALQKTSMPLEDQNRIRDLSSYVFTALEKHLFHGLHTYDKWNLDKEDKKIIIALMLAGEWEETVGDTEFLSNITGLSYDDVKLKLSNLVIGEYPLFVSFKKWSIQNYRVVDRTQCWEFIKSNLVFVTSEQLNKYEEYVIKVLMDLEGLPKEEFDFNRCKYTDTLKHSLLKNIICASISGNEVLQVMANRLCNRIFENFRKESCWIDCANYMPELMEAAPEVVISLLTTELDNYEDNKLKRIFSLSNEGVFGGSKYTPYLFALELALFIPSVKFEAINILHVLANYEIEYKLVNKPVETLQRIYCPWISEIALTNTEKINLLKHYASKYNGSIWGLLKEIIPFYTGNKFYSHLNKPNFVFYDINYDTISIETIKEQYREYFNLGMDVAGNDLNKWANFFECCTFEFYGLRYNVLSKIQDVLCLAKDEEKYAFSKVLLKFISLNKINKRKGGFTEDFINEIKSLYNSISYQNSIFKYLYAFEDTYHTIEENIDWEDYTRNIEYQRLKQRSILRLLKNENRENCIVELLEMSSASSGAGFSYAIEFFENHIDLEMLNSWIVSSKIEFVTQYMWHVTKSKGEKFVIDYVEENIEKFDEKLLYYLLNSINISDDNWNRLSDFGEKLNYFWQHISYGNLQTKIESESVLLALLDTMLDVGNQTGMLYLLNSYSFQFEEYKKCLNNYSICSKLNGYNICSIFEKLYEKNLNNSELELEVARLEAFYIEAFKFHGKPKYLYRNLAKSPDIVCELLSYIYIKDDEVAGDNEDNETKALAKAAWHVLHEVRFCPAYVEGENFSAENILEWCNKFKEIMHSMSRTKIVDYYLAEFLANYPMDSSNIWPAEEICRAVEDNYNDVLARNFVNAVINSREVHYIGEGLEEDILADKYEGYAKVYALKYPRMAKILKSVGGYYRREAMEYRERAKYE